MSDASSVLVATSQVRARAELGVALVVAGASVGDAGTAQEVFDHVVARRPDVLIVDLDSVFGGLPLLRALHERGVAEDLRVVALAHPDDPASLAEAHLLGAERHVMVPSSIEEVVRTALEPVVSADGDMAIAPSPTSATIGQGAESED